MTEKIAPALTPREWTDPLPLFDQFIGAGTVRETITERLHGLAAVCLHEHPYGFTWEMVDAILHGADVMADDFYGLTRLMHAAADRIAALLPPRENRPAYSAHDQTDDAHDGA